MYVGSRDLARFALRVVKTPPRHVPRRCSLIRRNPTQRDNFQVGTHQTDRIRRHSHFYSFATNTKNMAPRRGAEVEQEPALGGLKFNEPLSWRAGKAIPIGELHKRLDALSNELQDMDQEETDKNSLTGVAKELAAHNLLSHKDKGVRAFTACCLVDVLKLCAPDAPFTGSQLKVYTQSSFEAHVADYVTRIYLLYLLRLYFPHFRIRQTHITRNTNMFLYHLQKSRVLS